MRPIGMQSVLLAPLAVPAWYLVVATADERGLPSGSDSWVNLAVAYLAAAAYLAFVPVGFFALWAQRRGFIASRSHLLLLGVFAAFSLAVGADLPGINFRRWAYYATAVAAGSLWALAMSVAGNLTNRSSGQTGSARLPLNS